MRRCALVSLLAAGVLGSAAHAAKPQPQFSPNTSYGRSADERLDAYSAAQPGSPVVIVVHGGGWHAGDKSHEHRACIDLVREGYACFAPNYSLAPAKTWPVQFGQMREVMTW